MSKSRFLAVVLCVFLSVAGYAQITLKDGKGSIFFSTSFQSSFFPNNYINILPDYELNSYNALKIGGYWEKPLNTGNLVLGLEVGFSSGSLFGGNSGVDIIPLTVDVAYAYPLADFVSIGPSLKVGGLGMKSDEWFEVVAVIGARVEAEFTLPFIPLPLSLYAAGGVDVYPSSWDFGMLPVIEIGIRFPRGNVKKSEPGVTAREDDTSGNTATAAVTQAQQSPATTGTPAQQQQTTPPATTQTQQPPATTGTPAQQTTPPAATQTQPPPATTGTPAQQQQTTPPAATQTQQPPATTGTQTQQQETTPPAATQTQQPPATTGTQTQQQETTPPAATQTQQPPATTGTPTQQQETTPPATTQTQQPPSATTGTQTQQEQTTPSVTAQTQQPSTTTQSSTTGTQEQQQTPPSAAVVPPRTTGVQEPDEVPEDRGQQPSGASGTPPTAAPSQGQQTGSATGAITQTQSQPAATQVPQTLPPVIINQDHFMVLDNGTRASYRSIYFEPDTATMIETYRPVLEYVAQQLAANPSMNVLMRAYAAPFKTEDGRYLVSLDRARFARDYLLEKNISLGRMSIEAYGSTRDPADVITENWISHRCVEFIMY